MADTKKETVPYDKGWAWMVVLGCFINNVCLLGVIKSFGLIIQEMKIMFHLPSSLAVLMSSIASVVFVLFAIFTASLAEYFSHRRIVMIGGAVGCMAYAFSSLLFSAEYVTCVYGVLFGLCLACSYGSNFVMVNKYFKKYRAIANGIGLCGAGVGQLSLPPLIRFLLDTYTLDGTLLILGGILFHITLGGCLYRPLSFYAKPDSPGLLVLSDKCLEKNKTDDPEGEHGQGGTDQDKLVQSSKDDIDRSLTITEKEFSTSPRDNLCSEPEKFDRDKTENIEETAVDDKIGERKEMIDSSDKKKKSLHTKHKFLKALDFRVVLDRTVFYYMTVIFLIFIGNFNFLQFLPLRSAEKDIKHYQGAFLISLCGIGDVIGRLAAGAVGNLNIMPKYCLMGIAAIAACVNVLMLNFATVYWWTCIHSALYGYFGGHYTALMTPVMIDFIGIEKMPKCVGVLVSVQGIGGAITQPLLGLVDDITGSFSPVIILTGSFMGIGGIILLCYPFVKKSQKNREDKKKENDMTVD